MAEKDIGGKFLIDRDPDGWVRWFLNDFTLAVAEILTTEFQFVGRRSDSLLKVNGPDGAFGALSELQLEPEVEMPARLQNYTAMARQKLGLPIVPIVIYLTPPAEGVELATSYHSEYMGLVTHQDFKVIRLWEWDAARVNEFPVTLLPFVPLMNGATEEIIYECARRIRTEPDHEEMETTLALFALMKLDQETVARMMRWSMVILEKSPIYQEILTRGREEGLEEGLEQGLIRGISHVLNRRFGDVPADLENRLSELSATTLESLLDVALTATELNAFEAELTEMK